MYQKTNLVQRNRGADENQRRFFCSGMSGLL